MGKTIFICKLCREKYSSLDGLYSHLESEHGDAIPEDMCVEQFYYFLKNGKENGKCVECGKPTLWNDKTKKYKRFCEDPECMEKYKETVRNRMIGKYGKVNLLNDPEQQRKMLMNRKISGLYDFNGVKIPYVGSYELDFLKTMDLFLDWDPNDILMPSPHNYYYMYNGEKKFYIPDVFIPSLGLEIEIKDGGNNPNMHHKIQDVDKEKERLKDEVMSTQKIHHYIKITNKNYYNLFDFFDKMKEGLEKYGDYDKIPKIIITEDIKTKQINPKSKSLLKKEANEVLKEGLENVEENLLFSKDNMEFNLDKFNGDNNILYIIGLCGSGKSTIIKKYAEKYNAEQLEFDAITSALTKGLDNLNKNKIHPIILEYLTTQNPIKLKNFSDPNFENECVKFLDWFEKKVYGNGKLYILEGMQIFLCFDPKRFIGKPMVVMGTSVAKSMYRNVSRKYKRTGDIQKTFKHFIATLNRTNIIIKNDRQISELVDVISESFNPDKALVWLDKPIDKLFNKKIKLYHGSIEDIKGNKIDPISINVGATKFSNPRWSTYFWDDIESAKQWAMTWIVQRTTHSNVLYRGHEGKSIIGNNTKYNDEKFIQLILKENPYIYIYETEIPISKLEMGSVPSIREYTVSESVPITKKHKIKVTKKMIQDYIEIKDDSIVKQMVDECPIDHMKNVRGFILNNILSNERDTYRLMIKNDIKNNKIKIGDDLSKYKNRINDAVKNDLYGLRESYNHYITLNINNNMNNGLYGFRDKITSLSFDNNHLKRVNHKLQQVEESCIDKENTTEIKIGYNGDIKPIINKNSNQGAFLLWNKKDSINTLLESISKEWFDSKLTIDDFHIIGGDNNVW